MSVKLGTLIATGALLAAGTVPAPTPAAPAPAAAAPPTVAGIDASHYQATIDWRSVAAAGKRFAFIKATEGTTLVDRRFEANHAAAGRAGMLRGAYHFARPEPGSRHAVREARHFTGVAGETGGPGSLPPVLDLEDAGGLGVAALRAWVRSFLQEVERLTGHPPVIYTSPSFWESEMGGSPEFAPHPLWVAHYTEGSPTVPGGWEEYAFWQHSETGSVRGIRGDVDLNRFNGTLDELRALAEPPGSERSDIVRAGAVRPPREQAAAGRSG
jgi:GH25 family lysozyme M1 (1,4-beta-N-acetylmuramidase)